MYFFKRFRSFNAKNLGSAGQRAVKLLAVKVGGLKRKVCTSALFEPVGSSLTATGFELFSKFDGW